MSYLPQLAKFHAVHVVVKNAPLISSVLSEFPLQLQRTFTGSGAPSGTTLQAGNGMYNATSSGFVIAAWLDDTDASQNYAVGDVLTVVGGSGTACQVTVDLIGINNTIAALHVSRVGNYSAYPSNPVSVTGGSSGTGAQFQVSLPIADFYLDTSSNQLYRCSSAGNNSTSTWVLISGGGGGNTWI